MSGPDFSNAATIGSVLTFIPGVMVGFIGFLVFGTTSFFRKIYTESLRECCGRRKNKAQLFDDERDDPRSWKALGSGGGRVPTYHCRVESGVVAQVELTRLERCVEKGGGMVRSTEAQKLPKKAQQQPWKTLGIDCPN
jgi:UPF0716 family protein affecting phage T7 exclusion